MRYLLDTDTCIEVIRTHEPVSSRLRETSPDDVAISAMTLAELRFGALNSSDPDLVIVTRNRKHFERVPGLDVEDWTTG